MDEKDYTFKLHIDEKNLNEGVPQYVLAKGKFIFKHLQAYKKHI